MALFRRIGLHKESCQSDGNIIVTKHPVATAIGKEIFARGGNSFDAAIAASFAVGVVEPYMSGVGGVGLAITHNHGTVMVFDGGPVSPQALDVAAYPMTGGGTDRDLFGWPSVEKNANLIGATSVCVPTMVALMEALYQQGASLSWSELIEPAVSLARSHTVDWLLALCILNDQTSLRSFPTTAEVFLPNGLVPAYDLDNESASVLHQERLADTLQEIADKGAAAFYGGAIGNAIARFLQSQGGAMDAHDLASYEVTTPDAQHVEFAGWQVWVPDGLNGGPTIAGMLKLHGVHASQAFEWGSAQELTAWVQAGTTAFRHRFAALGHANGTALGNLRGDLHSVMGADHGDSTTYLATADQDGNGVSLNLTLLSRWGSKLVVPETGILLNNGVMWFDPMPDRPNSIAPGVRPLANMAPLLVTQREELMTLLGASGGRKIISALPQILSNILHFGMEIQDAISAPRLELSTMPMLADPRISPEVLVDVEKRTGQSFTQYLSRLASAGYSSPAGLRRNHDGMWTAGMDPMGLAEAGCA